jgi:hypothetical protein
LSFFFDCCAAKWVLGMTGRVSMPQAPTYIKGIDPFG